MDFKNLPLLPTLRTLVRNGCLGLVFLLTCNTGIVWSQANPRGAFEYVARAGTSDDGALDMVYENNLLYVANKFSGLQIIDISNFNAPKIVSRTPSAGQNYGLAKKGNYIYMADNLSGFLVYDVSNPRKPKKVAELATKGEAWDVEIVDNYAYVAAGLAGLLVIDITDPLAPKEVGTLRYEKEWDYARKVFVTTSGRLYVADRKSGIHIIDISIPATPKEIKKYQTQFAVGVYADDNYAYVADGPGGLLVLDVVNPEKIRQVAKIDLPGHANDVVKIGNYAYIAIDDAGIRAIDVTNPTKPLFDARFDTPGQAFKVSKQDIFMLVADLSSVLVLIHNKPPVIYKVGDKTVAENQTLKFKVRGIDPDGNPITFSGNFIPEGAVFDPKDTAFTWTPSFEQSGKYEGIVFTVTENTQTKLFSRDTMAITVTHANRPPSLPVTGNYTVDENKPLTFTINAPTDPDVEDEGKLKVTLTNPPTGAQFDPAKLTFNWIPLYDQSGTYTLNFVVTDGAGATETKQSVITVANINRPPVFADLKNAFTVDENLPLNFQVSATDPDKEDIGKLEYLGFNLPPGAAFDKSTQTLSWTPTYEQSGQYDGLYFIVKDFEGLTDTVFTSITVNHVNRAPFLASIAAQQVDEDKPLTYKVTGDDPDVEDNGKLTIKSITLPEGAVFDEVAKTFSWKPTFDQSGDHSASFRISDPAGATDDVTVNIAVKNINRPPTIAAVQPQTGDENKEFTLVIPEGQDLDKEDIGKLTYTAENLPQGAKFDPQTRTIAWLPTYDQSGVYDGIKVTVKDVLGLTAAVSFKITINHVNRPPVMTDVPAQTVDETKLLSFAITASDPDKEDAGKLTYAAENLPAGATFDVNTHRFTWTPTFEQSGSYTVTFKVTDFEKLTDSKTATITVNNVNRAPKLPVLTSTTGDENKALTVSIAAAEDPDKEDAGKLTYKTEGLPQGATFDESSRTISWTPTYDQSGTYVVKITVTDAGGLLETKNQEIKITHVNRPPVMTQPSNQSTDESKAVTFTVEVSDPDKEDQGRLTVRAEGLPQGAVFNAQTRSFSWTPTYDQAGEYTVKLTVSDAAGLNDSKSVTVTVNNVNRKPALGLVTNQTTTENKAVAFTATATDPDKEDAGKLTFSADGVPDGATFGNDGKFSWTPTYDQAGDYKLTIKVKDAAGLEDSKSITIKVTNVNRPPKLDAVSNQDVEENKELSFKVSASDEDKDNKLTFTMSGAPAGATLSADGNFAWTPKVGQAGKYTVTFKVSDGTAVDTKAATITVAKAPVENKN